MVRLMHENMNYKTDDLAGKVSIPVIVSKQGGRIVYQLNLMFRQITSLFDHMPIKSSKDKSDYQDVDLTVLRNRFVKAEKVDEIVQYVSENMDSYILPPISAVTNNLFPVQPYNHYEIKEVMGEEFDLIQNPHLVEEVLKRFDGTIQGMLIMKESDFNIEIMDGNHRCASIHKLSTMGKEYKNMRIGVQIFFENDGDRQKQAFVDLNTSTPIDKTLLTLFGSRDPLSVAAKETIGKNPEFIIEEFNQDSPHYIGFDMMNDSVNKNAHSVLTLNIVKNMLIKFALGENGTKKKFEKEFVPQTESYEQLLREFKSYLSLVFERLEPFNKIKQTGVQIVPTLREQYVSLSGAGLYLIANLGHVSRTKEMPYDEFVDLISGIDWKREVSTNDGFEYNPIFRSGILNESGNISNNRSAQSSTLNYILEKLDLRS